ncbi:MAG: 50S ribosomal protein L35ae [bacterium]
MWGKIARAHGSNGVVIGRFKSNLPPRAMGATLRVMLYPNRE